MVYIHWCYKCGKQEAVDRDTSERGLYELSGRSACCGAFTDALQGRITVAVDE